MSPTPRADFYVISKDRFKQEPLLLVCELAKRCFRAAKPTLILARDTAQAVQDALAAGHVARLAGGFTGAGGFDDFANDDLGVGRALLQVVPQQFAHDVFHRAAHL